MHRALVSVSIVLLAVLATGALADSGPLDRLRAGSEAYLKKGPRSALVEWLSKGPLAGSKAALEQESALVQIEGYYGKYQGYSVVKAKSLSERVLWAYVILEYERGPVFGHVGFYRTASSGWVIPQFKFNTKPDKIWPASLLTE